MLCYPVPTYLVQRAKLSIGLVRRCVLRCDWLPSLCRVLITVYCAPLTFVHCILGFYIDGSLFPTSRIHAQHGLGETAPYDSDETDKQRLLLGPFCGKPACQFINVTPGKARGVCADAFVKQRSILVEDVNMYPGHIACDAETSSELVCPLVLYLQGNRIPIGVLDMDSVGLGGFDEDDRIGAERVTRLVVNSCDW